MLLGDAAGLVDPLTREGIYYALALRPVGSRGARHGPQRAGAAGIYAERLRAEIQPELARAARLSGLFFSPAFSALLVDALRQSAGIRDVFVDLVAGRATLPRPPAPAARDPGMDARRTGNSAGCDACVYWYNEAVVSSHAV